MDERDNKENISRSQRDRHLASGAERYVVLYSTVHSGKWDWIGVERRAHRPSVIFRKGGAAGRHSHSLIHFIDVLGEMRISFRLAIPLRSSDQWKWY